MRRIHHMPFGAELDAAGARFSLWCPTATSAAIVIDNDIPRSMPMKDGWATLRIEEVKEGARYLFEIDGRLRVPDPAARAQIGGPLGSSLVVDPVRFSWPDDDWRGRSWEEAVVWEAHVGAATQEGTFSALQNVLPRVADVGFTMIELMPLSDCCGSRNWGYDGVLPFAPNHAYGTPDDLKNLVAEAHRLGLSVMLDVVYNHFGPKGNFLPEYAGQFFNPRHMTPWGAAINFDGPHNETVRDYFVHNALYWLNEYHLDGLRFDAVHAIIDDRKPAFLVELVQRIRGSVAGRPIHLVLENEKNEARLLDRKMRRSSFYDAQWNDDLHHCWHRLLTEESEGYYQDFDQPVLRLGRALTQGFVYQGESSRHKNGEPRGEPSSELPPSAFVGFLQNHDQIGNRAFGERIDQLTDPRKLTLARAGLLLSPQIPLLFMGEEWSASIPFLFFVDYSDDPALSQAIRDGRRQEFARFSAFSKQELTPDPTALDAFLNSKLDWSETTQQAHASTLETIRALLQLRATHVTPLAKSALVSTACSVNETQTLDVSWIFHAARLRFVANFGREEVDASLSPNERLIWSSQDIAQPHASRLRLPNCTGFYSLCER